MSILREIQSVRENLGLWKRSDHTVLRVRGKDAASWLQAQVTNDVTRLDTGQGCHAALLDRQARVQAYFSIHRWEDEYWLLIERAQCAAFHQRVETHLFLEDVTVEDTGSDAPQILVEGPRAPIFLARVMGLTPQDAARLLSDAPCQVTPLDLLGHQVLAFRCAESGEDGYCLVPAAGETDALFDALLEHGAEYLAAEVSEAARHTLRAEAFTLPFGTCIDTACIVSETPLEKNAVDYGKGCYLGQEVVARLKSYATPKRALVALCVEDGGTPLPEKPAPLSVGGAKAGEFRCAAFSPTLDCWVAAAYLGREHRTDGAEYVFETPDGARFTAKVAHLPLIQPPARGVLAEQRYHAALERFEQDEDDTDDSTIALLEDALLLDPRFEDGYEALGVILHRHQRTDEAITWMQRLAELNPNCVMAHTNLSVFYVAKGMIQEAETEKAKAELLEMKKRLDTREAERAAAAERKRIEGEARQRIALFEEVLGIDPEDAVATMGLGTAYIQLGEFAKAVPHLETATRVKKDYSAAFLNLGKCHEFLGGLDAARAVFQRGIEAASRKGDLMPLREMERRLKAIDSGVG